MAQVSSAARPLPEEQSPVLETTERKSAPERAERPVEKALEGGSPEKIVSIFQGRATEEKQAMERLGLVDPEEAEAVPEAAAKVAEMTEQTRQKIDQVTSTTLMEVQALLGTPPAPANESMPVAAPAEATAVEAPVIEEVQTAPVAVATEAPKAETVQVMPTIKVGEAAPEQEPTPETSPEASEAAEQHEVAEEVMRENAEALTSFCHEHNVPFDGATMKVTDDSKLSRAERFYVQTLMGKYEAGAASKQHAEKLLEASRLPEGDPSRAALEAEAQRLAADAAVKEKAAMVIQQNYMNLPEIIAIAGGGGNESGGSYGGSNFEAQASPFGQKPPTGGSRGGMYDVGGAPGSGLTKIEAYKTPAEKVEKRKPNFIERFFNKNWKDLTFGGGGDGGGRE